MRKAEHHAWTAGLQPENQTRTFPFLAGLDIPACLRRRLIRGEPQPVDGVAVEKSELDGALRLGYIGGPPLAESGGGGDQREYRGRLGGNLNSMLNVGHGFALSSRLIRGDQVVVCEDHIPARQLRTIGCLELFYCRRMTVSLVRSFV